MAYLNFLQESERLSAQAHDYVSNAVMQYLTFLQSNEDSIPSDSAHLLALINDLLEYAQILQGSLKIQPTNVDLRKSINEVYSMLTEQACDKKLDYTLVFEGDIPRFVLLDVKRLTQVLLEVLSNAVKFTARGYVRVRVRMDDVVGSAGVLSISVTDSGAGIATQDQTRIFEPFVQLNQGVQDGTSNDSRGHGMGLSIAQSLLRLQEGTIEVTSRLGEGATFNIHLPVRIVEESLLPSTDTSTQSQGFFGKVLVVDDHQLNRLIAMSTLKRAFPDLSVDEAKNGSEAINKMSHHVYDLVLMDLVMPDLSGVEVVRRIRALPEPRGSVQVVALTANVADEAMADCEAVGITHVLSKPLDVDLLVKTVLELLPQPS